MSETPDLVILNGRLLTFDAANPAAEALAVAGGRIAAVGSTAGIRGLAGPGTRVFDAQGCTVLPGFIDSHVHLFGGSVELDYLNLYGVTGLDRLTELVRAEALRCPDDRVVFAVQADYDITAEGRATTRHDLDRVLPDRPFAMFAADHHTVWANTKALELAGILHGGATEAGAEIVMAPDGTAAGELREPGAYRPVLRHTRYGGRDMEGLVTGANPDPMPGPLDRARDRDAIAAGLRHCASHGITGLHNMDGNVYTGELIEELDAEGALLCRTEVPFHLKSGDPLDRLEEAAEMCRRFAGDRLWTNRVKMFMDGVIESRTALMLRPYPGTDHRGDPVFTPEHFNEACVRIDAMGMQIATHAIGDLAIRSTLDGYERARAVNGPRDSRHRVEHIEVLHPDDLPRFAELGVVASIQPGHAPRGHIFPEHGLDQVLHPDQIPMAFAWQTIRESGARVCFSTDWPVIQVDVMDSVRAAAGPREMPAPWVDQTQTLEETLRSYTFDNAWVEFAEDRKGRLAPGCLADIAVMDRDLFALEPAGLNAARAALTVMDGRITWEA
ncbi:amidohydrolase [Rhodosalinus sediminis]|uniref:Amidohydrolase n=1 Tax=Rhodosalinus sediminis TaxID=1940533 RepID=A0A3D9BPF2_9RHOB|nr:amidohydrolase [Rhodosalinus sediminis]REC55394.1 amidohydrolase [Rhodosalinus sediminis]